MVVQLERVNADQVVSWIHAKRIVDVGRHVAPETSPHPSMYSPARILPTHTDTCRDLTAAGGAFPFLARHLRITSS